QLPEQRPDLAARQHHRQAHGPLRPHQIVEPAQLPTEDLLVQKKQRGECLILRRCRDVALGGEMAEERRHLGFPERGRMTLAAPVDEVPDPVHVSLLRAAAVVQPPDRLVHLLEKAGPTVLQGFTPRKIRHLTLRAQPNITVSIYSTPIVSDSARHFSQAYTTKPD